MLSKTYALLFLDIVGSTAFIERVGSVTAAQRFFQHDTFTRTLIYRYEGVEIDKTDGFMIIFDRCIDAVNFALAYHRAIPKRTGLNARIGIHWGEVVVKENKKIHVEQGAKRIEVEGLAKPIGARIMSLAQGGQTLLSDTARKASEHRRTAFTPKKARFMCLGNYLLKGVKNPMLLHAVGVSLSDFRPPIETQKVKKVSPPPNPRQDWTLQEYSLFFLKGVLLVSFFNGTYHLFYGFWKMRWLIDRYVSYNSFLRTIYDSFNV